MFSFSFPAILPLHAFFFIYHLWDLWTHTRARFNITLHARLKLFTRLAYVCTSQYGFRWPHSGSMALAGAGPTARTWLESQLGLGLGLGSQLG